MIERCALGVILKRGSHLIDPVVNVLTKEEDDYLSRHVAELRRAHEDDGAIRAKFRVASTTHADLRRAQSGSDDEFLEVAVRMVHSLAATMRSSPRAKEDCVVALLTEPKGAKKPSVTFLKLDARIEAAHLERVKSGGIRLHVFQDLLPAPGDMQKGISWPDPRSPESDLILVDTNRGDAALYFSNAFSLDISSRAQTTETQLVDELVRQLGPARASKAAALAREGGKADEIVAKIKTEYPEFEATARSIGGPGGLPGVVRPGALDDRKRVFTADGIELRLPLARFDVVSTRRDGTDFVTSIRTSTPLFPLADSDD